MLNKDTSSSNSKAATTKHSSSDVNSRNKQGQVLHTFADEPIEFSEYFKRKEGVENN